MARHHRRRQTACTSSSSVYGGRASNDDTCRSSVVDSLTSDLDSVTYNSSSEVAPRHSNPSRRTKHYRNKKSSLRTEPRMEEASNQWLIQWLSSEVVRLASSFLECGKKCIRYISHSGEWNDQRRSDSGLSSHIVESSGYRNRRKRQKNCVDSCVTFQRTNVKGKKKKKSQHDKFLVRPKQRLSHYGGSLTESAAFKGLTTLGYDEDCINDILRILKTVYGGPKEVNVYKATVNEADEVSIKDSDTSDDVPRTSVSPTDAEHDEKDVVVKIYNSSYPSVESQRIATSSTEIGEAGSGSTKPPDENNNKSDRRSDERNTSQSGKYTNQANDSRAKQHGVDHDSSKPRPSGGKLRHTALKRGSLISNICDRKRTIKVEEEEEEIIYPDADEGGIGVIHKIRHSESTVTKSSEPACEPYLVCDEKRIERLPTVKRLIRDQSRIRIDLEDLNDCDQRSNNHGNSSNTSNRRLSVLPHPGRGPHRYSNSPEQTTDLEKSTADQGPERLVASSTGRLTGVLMEDDQNHSRQRSKTKSVVMSNIRPVLSTTDDSSADEDKECSDYVGKRKSEQNSNKTSDDFIGKEKKTDVERSSRTRVQGTSSDGDNIKPIHSINDNEQPAQKQHNNSIGQSESTSHQANLEILGISPSVSSKNEELSNITSPDITISGTRNTSSDAVRSSSYPDGEFQLSGEEKGVEEQVSGRVREGVVGTTAGLPANVIRSDTSGLNVHSGGRKLSPDIKPLVAKGSKRRNVESYNNPHQKLGSVEGQDPPSRSINEIGTLAQSTEYSARRVSSSSRRLSGVSKHSLSVDQVKPKDMTSSDKSNDAQQKVRSGGSVDTAVGSVEKGLLSEGASFTESKNSKMLGDGSNTKRTHGGSTVHSRRTSRQNISVPRSADIVSVPSPTGGSAVPLKDNSSYNSGKLRSSNEMSSIYLTNMSKATLDPTNNELAANGNDGKHPITSQLGIGPVTKTNQAEHVPADDAKDEENTGPLIALVESQKFDSEASGKILPDIPNEPGDLNSAKSNEKGESSDPPPNSQLNLVPQENKSANNLKQELSKSSSAVRRLIGEFGTGHSIEGIVDRSSSLIDQNDKIMTEKGNESRSLVDENATAHSVDSDPKSGTTTEIPEVEKSANQNESHVKENLDVTMNMLPEKALDGNTEEVSSMLKNSASLDHNRASPIPATPTDDLVLESPYTSKSTNESLPSQPKVFAPKRSEIKLQGMDTGEKSSDKDSSAGKLEILKSNDEYRNKQEVSSDTKEKYVLPTSTYIGPPVDSKPTISGSTLSAEPPIISFPQPTLGSGEGSSQSIIKSPGAPSDPNLSQGVSAIAAAARDRFHAIQGSTPQPRKSINTPDDHVGVTFSKRRQSYMYVRMNSSATQDAPSGVQSENPKNVILQEGSKPNQVIEPVPTGAKREMSVCVLPTIKEVDDEEVHPYIRQRESPAEIRKSRRASRISKGPSLALRRRSSRSSSNPIITTLDSGEGDEAQGSDYVSHSTKQAGGPCNCRSICNCCTCGKNKEPKRSVPEKLEDPKDYSIETDGPFDYSTPPYPKDSMKVLSSPFFAHWTYYDVDQDHPLAKHLKRAEHTALDTECIIMKNYRLGDLCIPYLNITARKKISTKLVCNYYKKRSLLTKKRDAKAHADMSRCGSGGSPLQDDFRRGEGPCSCEEKRAAKHRGDSNIWEGYVDTEDDFVIPIELKKEVREEQYDNITSPDLPDSVFSCDLGGDCNCVQLPEYVREAQPLLLPTTPCESCECFVEEVASDPSVQSVFIQGSVTTAISFEDDSSKNTGIGEYVDNLEDLVIQLYGMIGKMKNVVEESNAGSTHEKHFGSKKESLL